MQRSKSALTTRSAGPAVVVQKGGELASAVGRRPAPSPARHSLVLQPKVGYEFQTGWLVRPSNSICSLWIDTPLVKSQALVQGDGWKLTSDDGEVEFIVDPPIEEGDYSRLRTVFSGVRRMTNELIRLGAQGKIDTSNLDGVTFLGKCTVIDPDGNTLHSLAAKPQVSAGIRLSKMRKVMAELGDQYSTASELYESGRGRMLRQVAVSTGSINGSEVYKGLVSTMAAYVVKSSSMWGVTSSVKDLTSLMSRTNLAVAFKFLPEFKTLTDSSKKTSFKARFLQDVLHVAVDSSKSLEYVQRAAISDKMKMLPPVVRGLVDPETLPRTGPTVREWVEGVVDGTDKLAVSVSSTSTWRTSSLSMGAMGRGESVGGNKPGAIVELRDLNSRLAHNQWADWAEQFLEWFTKMNDPKSGDTSFPGHSKRVREERFRAWRRRQIELQIENEKALEKAKEILSNI